VYLLLKTGFCFSVLEICVSGSVLQTSRKKNEPIACKEFLKITTFWQKSKSSKALKMFCYAKLEPPLQ